MAIAPARTRLALSANRDHADLPEVGLAGTGLHPFAEAECVDFILDQVEMGRGGWVTTSSLDYVVRAERDATFRTLYEESTLRIPTGPVLVWACSLQRTPLPECVSAIDLLDDLAREAVSQRYRIYLIASEDDIARDAAKAIEAAHPGVQIVGASAAPGDVERNPLDIASLSREIDASQPDFVFVGLESPLQEELIQYLRHGRPEAWWIGCGPTLRILSGRLAAAPRWMESCGFEWVHRLAQEPLAVFKRFLVRGLPGGVFLLARCAVRGTLPRAKKGSAYGARMPRVLVLDDDRHALDHLELLLSSRFPDLVIETRTEPDASGAFDFYFIDNDFDGTRLAAKLAGRIREERPTATIIAFSGLLDVSTLKHLINIGCDGVCDKAEPSNWRPILALIEERLANMVTRNRVAGSSFGGVRRSAHAIHQLLDKWNRRDADARGRPVQAAQLDRREVEAS